MSSRVDLAIRLEGQVKQLDSIPSSATGRTFHSWGSFWFQKIDRFIVQVWSFFFGCFSFRETKGIVFNWTKVYWLYFKDFRLLNQDLCTLTQRRFGIFPTPLMKQRTGGHFFFVALIATCCVGYLYCDWSLPPTSGHLSFWTRIRMMLMKRIKFTFEKKKRERHMQQDFLVCLPTRDFFHPHRCKELCSSNKDGMRLLREEEDGKRGVHVSFLHKKTDGASSLFLLSGAFPFRWTEPSCSTDWSQQTLR